MQKLWKCSRLPQFTCDMRTVAMSLVNFEMDKIRTDTIFNTLAPLEQKVLSAETLANNMVASAALGGVAASYDAVHHAIAKALEIPEAHIKVDEHAANLADLAFDIQMGTTTLALDDRRICFWHNELYQGMEEKDRPEHVGSYRDISSKQGEVLPAMKQLLAWINKKSKTPPLVKSAIATLTLEAIQPFEKGNETIARFLGDCILSSDWSGQRAFSISSAILEKKKEYDEKLDYVKKTQDITEYVYWFIGVVIDSMTNAADTFEEKIQRSQSMMCLDPNEYNSRELSMLYQLASGRYQGRLTAEKYTTLMKCTSATSTRDLTHLVEKGLLVKSAEGGRTTWYRLA